LDLKISTKYKCKICNQEFNNRIDLSRHIRYDHKIKILDYMLRFKKETDGFCLVCGEPTTFRGLIGWAKFCRNSRCSQVHESTKNKKKENSLKKYGTEHPSQCKEIRDKTDKTNLEKYGNKCSLQCEENQEKSKKTKLERYGSMYYNNRDKFLETMTPDMLKLKHEKTKKTKLERYGSMYYNNRYKFLETMTPEKWTSVKFKMQKTKLEKYNDVGYNNISKQKETILNKYGTDNTGNKHIKNFSKFRDKKFILENFVYDGYFDRDKFMEYFNCSLSQIYKTKELLDINVPNKTTKSKIEKEISEFIPGSRVNDRYTIQPKEIDVYSEKYKLGIEYDGLMWHSFGISSYRQFNNYESENTDKNKHIEKTELCEAKGIQLFHIFENEWLNSKKSIWVSMIHNKLHKSTRVHARKCYIQEIPDKTSKEFLDQNHLEGYAKSDINIGLFYNNELYQVMTFKRNQNEYELLRFCSRINHVVVGGLSKLLKYFEQNYKPESIISYANRRWSQGRVYEIMGFSLKTIVKPRYFYFNNKNILEKETKNMYLKGYRKIYDCGYLLYIKRYKYSKRGYNVSEF